MKRIQHIIMMVIILTVAPISLTFAVDMPEDVKQALDAALADPPITCEFLQVVANDSSFRNYLEKSPVKLSFQDDSLGNVMIIFETKGVSIEAVEEEGNHRYKVGLHIVGEGRVAIALDESLTRIRTSEFWAAFKKTLSAGR